MSAARVEGWYGFDWRFFFVRKKDGDEGEFEVDEDEGRGKSYVSSVGECERVIATGRKDTEVF